MHFFSYKSGPRQCQEKYAKKVPCYCHMFGTWACNILYSHLEPTNSHHTTNYNQKNKDKNPKLVNGLKSIDNYLMKHVLGLINRTVLHNGHLFPNKWGQESAQYREYMNSHGEYNQDELVLPTTIHWLK